MDPVVYLVLLLGMGVDPILTCTITTFLMFQMGKVLVKWMARKLKLRKLIKRTNSRLMTMMNKAWSYCERRLYQNHKIAPTFRYLKHSKSNYSRKFYSTNHKSKGARCKRDHRGRHLLAAAILLSKTPMYKPTSIFSHRKFSPPNYIDLNMFTTQDHNNTSPHDHQCSPLTDDSEYFCCSVVDDDFDDDIIANQARHTNHNVQAINFDSNSYPIGIDSLASACMSHVESDFIKSSLKPYTEAKSVKPYGKGSRIPIASKGTLRWKIEDDTGRKHTFLIPNSLYIPEGSIRLLSPQHWAREALAASKYVNKDAYRSVQLYNRNLLIWGQYSEYRKTIYNSRRSNVPIMYTAAANSKYIAYQSAIFNEIEYDKCYMCCEANVTPSDSPPSNTPSHVPKVVEEAMDDVMTHLSPRDPQVVEREEEPAIVAATDQAELMRWHYRLGHLSFKKLARLAEKGYIPKKLAKVRAPKCAGCIYGKMHRVPWRTKAQPKEIFTAKTPGQCISVDQMESSTVGFVGQGKGKLTKDRYRYATVFVDNYSRYVYVHLQKHLTSKETLEAKSAFEAHCRRYDVKVKHYHADNGRFADNMFLNDVVEKGQTISYCGVNAHWQNGIAERMIRSLRETGRTQLLHAIERWPTGCSTHLWPYAISYSAHILNQVPNKKDDLCPQSKFSGIDVSPNLNHMHTFGCPVYALNSKLAAQQSIGHWNRRARLGIYLGPSPRHAKSVSLVMNPANGLVSPQFHIKHDEFFETIDRKGGETAGAWKILAGLNKGVLPRKMKRRESTSNDTYEIPGSDIFEDQADDTIIEDHETNMETIIEDEKTKENPVTSISNRSGRKRKRTQALQDAIDQGLGITSFKSEIEEDEHEKYYEVMHEDDYKLQDDMLDPIAFKATGNPDDLYYHQALKEPDKEDFLKAIVTEINNHIEGNHWEMVPIEEVPKGTKILDSVWAMKRKRDIRTQQVYKYKARLNIHGGQQEYGVHYTNTYSPVVNWYSVRLLLILAKINGYFTRQVDFVLAYPQADLPFDNFMKLPKGVTTKEGRRDTHVLKLKKNIYGGKNSGLIWYDYLRKGLENIGFVCSPNDECVFFRKDVIFFFYVDDGIFISKSNENIDKAIRDLKNKKKAKQSFNMEDQGDITDYLGINFDKLPNGNIKMWQPHLIEQIVKEVGINPREKMKVTPAMSTKILGRYKEAPPAKPPFNYRRIIGKLNYLEKSTRPDVAYAVHQCARFCSDPKEEHVKAVIHLVKYLHATKEEGIILKPNKRKSFEVWVDADFSGNWNKTTAKQDASTSKSRSGYVLTYGDCPIFWASKLQTQIALSSCEAEYISLSQSLRDAIPVMRLLQELKDRNFGGEYTKPKVYCKAFEDNTGALALAMVPKIRPRTKHINLVYHHFREEVRNGTIEVVSVDTKNQIADMFTKPLAQNLFTKFRKELMGW